MEASIKDLEEEVEAIKGYLSELVEISLGEIGKVEPDEGEKELFSKKVKEEEYSDWDTVKNEL